MMAVAHVMRLSLVLVASVFLASCASWFSDPDGGWGDEGLTAEPAAAPVSASTKVAAESAIPRGLPDLVLEYPLAEEQPAYQKGFEYLPIAFGGRMTWVVQGGQSAYPGTPVALTTWYGQGGRILRLHGSKLADVVGYGARALRVADNCPFPDQLIRQRTAYDCVRTFLAARPGLYMSRVRVRQLPAERIRFSLGKGADQPGWIVREELSASGRQGNFYLFDATQKYVMSRQWLSESDAFDVFAAEQAQ